jgi:hypothetical protein
MPNSTVPAAATGLPTINRRSALAKLGLGLAASTSLAATAIAAPNAVSPELARLIEAHRVAWDAFLETAEATDNAQNAASDVDALAMAICAYPCRTIEEARMKAAHLQKYPGLVELGDTRLIEALVQSFCEQEA